MGSWDPTPAVRLARQMLLLSELGLPATLHFYHAAITIIPQIFLLSIFCAALVGLEIPSMWTGWPAT